MDTLPDSAIILLLGFVLILLILCVIIAWTIRISFRLCRLVPPKFRILFLIAFLQVIFGGCMILIMREINNNATLAIGSGAGMAILTGLFNQKWFFKFAWKKVLGVWAIATGLQIVIVPVMTWGLLIGWIMLAFIINPPQF